MKSAKKQQIQICPPVAQWNELFEQFETPTRVIEHSYAVAKKTFELGLLWQEQGNKIDLHLAYVGAVFHDIAKVHHNHAEVGANWLYELGYNSLAVIVENHMTLSNPYKETINPVSLVYLADKLVKGVTTVSLKERFEEKIQMFYQQGNLEAWQAALDRYNTAVKLYTQLYL